MLYIAQKIKSENQGIGIQGNLENPQRSDIMPAANVKLPAVDEGRDYWHVRFKVPWQFETCRTPDWAQRAANSISKGAEVRMCQKDDTWSLQSVLIKKSSAVSTKRKAKSLGIQIRNKIEKSKTKKSKTRRTKQKKTAK